MRQRGTNHPPLPSSFPRGDVPKAPTASLELLRVTTSFFGERHVLLKFGVPKRFHVKPVRRRFRSRANGPCVLLQTNVLPLTFEFQAPRLMV